MNDPNTYESPGDLEEHRLEVSDETVAALHQTRSAAIILCLGVGLFTLHRTGMIVYTALRFPLVWGLYGGTGFYSGAAGLGLEMTFIIVETALGAVLCRSLLRYITQIRTFDQHDRASIKGFFVRLKSVLYNLAILAVVVVVARVASAVYWALV